MKKLLIILLITGIYLYMSYVYFYRFLEENHLVAPVFEESIIINNKSGNKNIKYVALGDSLTAGVGVSDYKSSYPYLIALKIPSYKVELINLAYAGATSKDVLINQIPKAISAKPDLVTLLIGVNDIHNLVSSKMFENNLTQTIKALKDTHARIYLLSIPYLGSDKIVRFPYNLILNLKTKQFNNVIRKISKEYGIRYIDLYNLSKSASFYSSDQFHPGEKGYKDWAKIINVN